MELGRRPDSKSDEFFYHIHSCYRDMKPSRRPLFPKRFTHIGILSQLFVKKRYTYWVSGSAVNDYTYSSSQHALVPRLANPWAVRVTDVLNFLYHCLPNHRSALAKGVGGGPSFQGDQGLLLEND